MTSPIATFDPKLDLKLEREIDVPVHLVWKVWTTPAHLKEWFVPKPWTIASCELDLKPGGIFRTVMQGPDGEQHDHTGCWLEVVPHSRLVWTDTLLPGFRPAPNPFVTAVLTLEEVAEGTRYTATVMHKDAGDRERHEAMGFQEGWGKATDQLIALMRAER